MADNNNDLNPTNSIMVEDTQQRGKRQKAWTEQAAQVVAAVEQSLMATTTAVLVDEATAANPQQPPEQQQQQQMAGSVNNSYEPTPPDASFLMETENQGDDLAVPIVDKPAQQDIVVNNEVEENAEGSLFDPSYLTMVDDAQLVEDEVYMRLAMDLATQKYVSGGRSPLLGLHTYLSLSLSLSLSYTHTLPPLSISQWRRAQSFFGLSQPHGGSRARGRHRRGDWHGSFRL
jgi:hypothetical protein